MNDRYKAEIVRQTVAINKAITLIWVLTVAAIMVLA